MTLIPELEEVRISAEALPDEVALAEGVRECVVCLEGGAVIVGWVMLRPCGHVCVCNKCSAGLVECPLCRHAVSDSFPAFL